MNGPELPIRHGAPVRLKMPRQLGYKSVKYLHRITVTETVKNIGKGVGGANLEDGCLWTLVRVASKPHYDRDHFSW
jgi:DMSO/TMAO reductase YedYZ molybdopterin-dependent catalytic subunit